MGNFTQKIAAVLFMAVLCLFTAAPADAQSVYALKSGSLTAASSSCTSTTCVFMDVISDAGTVAFQIAGTYSATVQFEGSVDSTNFVALPATPIAGGTPVTSTTATSVWQANVVGLRRVRARVSAYTSGTATVTLVRSGIQPPINPVSLPVGISAIAGAKPGIWAGGFSPAALTSGTDTLGIANQQWIAPVWVPTNTTITGVAFLIGSVGGTDKAIVSLYNAAGTLLANSTTSGSGTTVGTSGTLQSLAFTTSYAAAGPGLYWVAVQTNGTTAKIRTIPLGKALVGTNAAGAATPSATITPPSSFTADTGPVAVLY